METTTAGPVLLASYPKSGNTWFRFILFHLYYQRMPVNSVELDDFINSKIGERKQVKFKKTHACFAHAASLGIPISGVIYIVRHPLDVLQSSLNYALLTGEKPDAIELDTWKRDWIESYVDHLGHPAWRAEPYFSASWAENVTGWLKQDTFPILTLKYEDALVHPNDCVKKIVEFLGLEIDSELIARCVTETSFDRLKEFENAELRKAKEEGKPVGRFSSGARLQMAEQGMRFFNTGKNGSYKQVLPLDLLQKAESAFAPAASAFGYFSSQV